LSGAAVDDSVQAALRELFGPVAGSVRLAEPAGGGCISRAAVLELADGRKVFCKEHAADPPGLFAAEADGLRALRAAGGPFAPEALAVIEGSGRQFILIEYIRTGRPGRGFFERLGRELAGLHGRPGGTRSGFPRDNHIGATPQPNAWTDGWVAFFRENRLGWQLRLARSDGSLDPATLGRAERLLERLERLLPEPDRLSLLHGDLWGGNVLAAADGRPALIDPAVYYGHREADLAMTELFGGFPADFYGSYREVQPLDPGYPERRDLYNLYHILNHCHLFGGAYAAQASSIIRRHQL
jgi:protein-ribulosamine 3-kinase